MYKIKETEQKTFYPALILCLFALVPASMESDAFTSVSIKNHYGDFALEGEELMNAMNSFSGFYQVATTNPDGSPNSAYFIFGCKELNGKYYVQLGLENQSLQNLQREKVGVAVYAKAPSGEEGAKPYAVSGARIRFRLVEDEALIKELQGTPSGLRCMASLWKYCRWAKLYQTKKRGCRPNDKPCFIW